MDELSEITLSGLIIEIAHGLSNQAERFLVAEYGMPLVSFEVMLRLFRTPGHRMRLADLADQVTMTRSGLTRAVDRLEAEGMVAREHCPKDRRGTWAVLTDAGARRIEPVAHAHIEQVQRSMLEGLSSEQRQQLAELLEHIRDRANPAVAAASRRASEPTDG